MRTTLRAQRLRLPWLLSIPFLFFARPTPLLLLFGLILALPGLALRIAASGHIQKDRVLAVHGPYAHLRHPLYVGSFLVGLGLVLGGGVWLFLPPFLLLFFWLYVRAVGQENGELEARFGQAYREYRAAVPAVLPRLGGSAISAPSLLAQEEEGVSPGSPPPPGFHPHLFVLNRGWEAPLGALVGFGLLWGKMAFLS